jgi:uncharacterized membrane protein YhhN
MSCVNQNMPAWLPIPFLAFSLTLLIRAQDRAVRNQRQIKIWKPLSTLLVIAVCALSLTQPAGAFDAGYTLLILAGLVLSLIGDVLLIDQDNSRAFSAGLIAFLLAHVLYIAAFVHLQSTRRLEGRPVGEVAIGIGLIVAAAIVYRFLSPGLGTMRAPVIAYVLVISIMLHRAAAVALTYDGQPALPALLVSGALLFYLSDAILAVNKFRFGGRLPHYSLWNLSAYYAGQLLIALSASFI